MSIDLEQFHQIFFEESLENIDAVEQALIDIDLDSAFDSNVINSIFRAAHSIKGGSGTFGFIEIANFTHLMETLLDEVRDGHRLLSRDIVDTLLASCDCLRNWFDSLQAKESIDTEISRPITKIYQAMLNVDSTGDESTGVDKPKDILSDSDHHHAASEVEVAADNYTDWSIEFIPNSDVFLSGNEPIRLFKQLQQMGEYRVTVNTRNLPDIKSLIVDECYLSWNIQLKTTQPKKAIEEVFEWVIDDCELIITDTNSYTNKQLIEATNPVVEDINNPVNSGVDDKKVLEPNVCIEKSLSSPSIRVGVDKVDDLINLVGELVITQSMLSELGNDFDMSKIDKLSNGLEQLLQNTKELQDHVMGIRMLPINFSFNRFPRMVRDFSEKTGKKIDLIIHGESTEIDKTVMEKIGDPLVHLVRNAIDHGIETPKERLASGKPEKGTITLDAYHKGGSIIVEVSDDGKGIDVDAVIQKALDKQIISSAEGVTDPKAFELIFEPGFSTAKAISDLSGRGVGMDVVKKNIKSLGGRIEIESEEGRGALFRVHLPLTLAILDGQLIRVGSEVYIIPLISIIESLQIKPGMIKKVSGNMNVCQLRDENIPIVSIAEEFGVPSSTNNIFDQLLVVVEGDDCKVGLLVDNLLSQQQVVIKSLENNYKKIDGVSSATILGDGSVAMIVDIPGLISMSNNKSVLINNHVA